MNVQQVAWINEAGRKMLATFLRTRREHLTPEEVGIATTRSRRTPGLRREEVAFLADIGVKWYARLEMGDDVHPSPRTLMGISRALRLSKVDTEYLFELAGLTVPREPHEPHVEIPETLTRLIISTRGTVAVVTDLFLTPLRWNAIFDAIWSCSSFASPLERNALVRTFDGNGFMQDYTGEDYQRVTRDAVGLFRRYYTAGDPSPFAQQIYDRIKGSSLFQAAWDACTVTDQMNPGNEIVRHHPDVGTLTMLPIELQLPHLSDLVARFWFAGDEDTQRRFDRLETMGKAWSPEKT